MYWSDWKALTTCSPPYEGGDERGGWYIECRFGESKENMKNLLFVLFSLFLTVLYVIPADAWVASGGAYNGAAVGPRGGSVYGRMEALLEHVHTEDVAVEVTMAMPLQAPVVRVLRLEPQVQTMVLQKQPILMQPFS